MNGPTPDVLELSRRIMGREIGGREAPEEIVAAIEVAFHRLCEALFNLVGHAGGQALLARAIDLTRREFGWLEAVLVEAGVCIKFNNMAERVVRESAPRVIDCAATLLANLIGLLCAFIGEDLTMRLVARIWAEVPRGHAGPGFKEGR
jgi:hypothetical protein